MKRLLIIALLLVPAAAACLWAGFYFYRHRNNWDWMEHGATLLPVSLLVSPYAWSTDQAILLPALLFVIQRASSNAVLAMALGSAMIELAPLLGFDMHSRFHLYASLFWLGLFYMLRLQALNAYDPPPPGAECIQA